MNKRVARALVSRSPVPELVFRFRARGRLTVIMYHSVRPPRARDYPFDDQLVSATPEAFEQQLRFFRSHLDVLSVSELLDCLHHPTSLPRRPALITFDDGHADNHDIALPLLRQYRLPACFFLTTGFIGTSVLPWWDQIICCLRCTRLDTLRSPFGMDDPPFALGPGQREVAISRFIRQFRAVPAWDDAVKILGALPEATDVTPATFLKRPLFMSWEHVRRLAAAGMELGGHTRTHPMLSRISDPSALRNEIAGCSEDIRAAVGRMPLAFAYPTGGEEAMSAAADAEIRGCGFRIWFSAVHSFAPLHSRAVARTPRVRINFGDDHRAFRMALARLPAPAGEEGIRYQ